MNFPLITEMRSRGPFAYLDSAATTLKPTCVIESLTRFYREQTSNVHRGVYSLAAEVTALYEQARERAADFLHAHDDEIIFTSGATAGLNLLANGLPLSPGDVIVLSEVEHHSNLLPWQRLALRAGAQLRWVPVLLDGKLDEAAYLSILREGRVKVVSLTAVSHVLGNSYDLARLFAIAREFGVQWTIADACQAPLRGPLDVKAIGCDALVFSGHKAYGPSGVGVLFVTRELQRSLEPFHLGGGMVDEVDFPHSRWLPGPRQFEAGTPPIEQAIALGEALEFIRAQVKTDDENLATQMYEGLAKRSDIHFFGWPNGKSEARGSILAFSIDGVHPHDVAQWLADRGVAVRAGHHCAQVLHRKLNAESGTVRVSLAPYTEKQDIDLLLEAMNGVESLRRR